MARVASTAPATSLRRLAVWILKTSRRRPCAGRNARATHLRAPRLKPFAFSGSIIGSLVFSNSNRLNRGREADAAELRTYIHIPGDRGSSSAGHAAGGKAGASGESEPHEAHAV